MTYARGKSPPEKAKKKRKGILKRRGEGLVKYRFSLGGPLLNVVVLPKHSKYLIIFITFVYGT